MRHQLSTVAPRALLAHGMRAVLGCFVLMALSAVPALAAPSWSSPPTSLVAPIIDQHAEEPQVAVDAKGDAIAVWREDTVSFEQFIMADVRPAATGVWGAPVAISTSEDPGEPHVAIDAEGEAVAVWVASNDHAVHYVVQAATGSATTGIWKAAVNLSSESQYANEPQIAVNATGQAAAAWRGNEPGEMIEAAVEPVKGEWQTPIDISGVASDTRHPQITIDSHGDAVAAWGDYNGTYEYAESSTLPAGGAWQTPVTLSAPGQDAEPPQVAADASGDVLATWTDYANETIQSVQGSAGSGTWQKPVDIGPNPENHGSPDLAVNTRGDALVTWGRNNTTEHNTAQAALGSAVSGEWQTPIDVITSSEKNTSVGKVTLDPQGDALAIWKDQEGGETVVQAAAMPTGTGSFSAPVSLSTTGEDVNEPQVAFGGAGIGVATWEEGEEDSNTPDATIVQAAAYTGTVIVPVVPSVTTGPASAVEQASATVTGTVNPNGSEVTACYFEYGTSTSYGSKASCSQAVGSGEARVAVSAPLSGLSPGTTYYYRVVAKNTAGAAEGDPKTFTTGKAPSYGPETKTTTSTTPTPVTTTVAPQLSPVLECSTAQVALINVVQHGSRVLITGAARLSLVGKRVSIKFLASGKTVATTTIAVNGSFSASAPLPPAKIRESNRARYEASVGSVHSLNLKLTRRMYMTSATRSGAHVLLSGYVTGSFKAGSTVKILLRVTCFKEEVIAKVKLTRAGKFSATVPAPKGAASQIAVYRGTTTVLAGGRPETTYTLPTPPSS